MRLLAFEVTNFQSYEEPQELILDPHVTFLAGRNNVGKSALLRALQIPLGRQGPGRPGLSLGYRFLLSRSDIGHGGDGAYELQNWLFADSDEIEIQAKYSPSVEGSSGDEPNLTSISALGALATGQPSTQFGWTGGPLDGTVFGVAELRTALNIAIRAASYLGPRRVHQGERTVSASTTLDPSGENLTDVLFHLQLNRRRDFEHLEDIARRAFPEIDGLLVRVETNRPSNIQGEPHVRFDGGLEIPLRLCGTGIEQLVALAAGILTVKPGGLFLIDEPQAHLHPHAERTLLEVLLEHDEHQYVIATHSHLLLGACRTDQVRLIYKEMDGHSRIAADPQRDQVLDALGISAADLWLADSIVWVEGPTEVALLSHVADRTLAAPERARVTFKAMPIAASRFLARKKGAEEAYEFCARASEAVSPLPVHMCFLFDADEKADDFKKRIDEVSGGRARFLHVREIENLLLDPALIADEVIENAAILGLGPPSREEIAREIEQLLAKTQDLALFPGGPPKDADPRERVRASHLLNIVWFKFLKGDYDKVRDGLALCQRAMRDHETVAVALTEVLTSATARDQRSAG